VLLALAAFSSSDDMCRPSVVHSEQPFLNIVNGRHPCMSPETYIPNSCKLGVNESEESSRRPSGTFILLTGPNMGGKSTLMRQAGTLCILAHMVSQKNSKDISVITSYAIMYNAFYYYTRTTRIAGMLCSG